MTIPKIADVSTHPDFGWPIPDRQAIDMLVEDLIKQEVGTTIAFRGWFSMSFNYPFHREDFSYSGQISINRESPDGYYIVYSQVRGLKYFVRIAAPWKHPDLDCIPPYDKKDMILYQDGRRSPNYIEAPIHEFSVSNYHNTDIHLKFLEEPKIARIVIYGSGHN